MLLTLPLAAGISPFWWILCLWRTLPSSIYSLHQTYHVLQPLLTLPLQWIPGNSEKIASTILLKLFTCTCNVRRFESFPAASNLFGCSDAAVSIAQHLAKKFKYQVFVSYNLPAEYELYQLTIEKLLIEKLSSISANWVCVKSNLQSIIFEAQFNTFPRVFDMACTRGRWLATQHCTTA